MPTCIETFVLVMVLATVLVFSEARSSPLGLAGPTQHQASHDEIHDEILAVPAVAGTLVSGDPRLACRAMGQRERRPSVAPIVLTVVPTQGDRVVSLNEWRCMVLQFDEDE